MPGLEDSGVGVSDRWSAATLRGRTGRRRRSSEVTRDGPGAKGVGADSRVPVVEATGLGADAAARALEAGRGDRKLPAFVRPPRPLRPLASRPPPGPCPRRAGLRGPAARAPALVLFGLGEEGQLFSGRAPPVSQCACSGVRRRALLAAGSRMLRDPWPDFRRALPRPTVNCLQAGSKDAGGSDWLRRARPPGFSAPAAAVAAITEFPVVSVRS